MSIDVGQTLDKYELLEKVGQGGMAVVYRGRDTTLRRQVAVKVLHRHLAEHKEARDRFEREAQAVAKLRHENILEIFDFSGGESKESYIVTEFIDGTTLKDFIAEHPLRFPEVGAMIALQVCRALAHAHSLGVLHRDVKPENIMIRSDGVVKLTDFGIAQMLDLQRMTVTGQLLGSPAYMSPEHVEGGQLDFRTDVFAVGIVLYQLCTGKLPFRGKNPHEILKRIAECKYRDARLENPLVGKELAAIIDTALAREPGDRYADVSLLSSALEQYLRGSGLTDFAGELARFFAAPVACEMALETRLVDHLSRRGRELFDSDRNAALELFNRVLSIDPDNREVLAIIDRLGRRQRTARIAALVAGALLVGGGAIAAASFFGGDEVGGLAVTGGAQTAGAALVDVPDASARVPAAADPAVVAAAAPAEATADAAVPATAAPPERGAQAAERDETPERAGVLRTTEPREDEPDAAVAAPEPVRTATLVLTPRHSEYRLPGGEWTAVEGTRAQITLPPGATVIEARNESCCQADRIEVPAGDIGRTLRLNLRFLPGAITPVCERPGTRVKVDGKPARLDQPSTIVIQRLTGTESVAVEFIADDRVDEHSVTVGARQSQKVRCRL